jgi:hypothetical protein
MSYRLRSRKLSIARIEWWFCAGAERKENGYTLDCQTCDIENPSGFKMRDRFTTVTKDVYEKMQMDDLREEQEERKLNDY